MIYVASPYSRYPHGPTAAFEVAARVCGQLAARGEEVYSPIVHSHPLAVHAGLDPYDIALWQRVDAPFMEICSECWVIKMTGWETSAGVSLEVGWFKDAGKPVRYIDPDSLEVSEGA